MKPGTGHVRQRLKPDDDGVIDWPEPLAILTLTVSPGQRAALLAIPAPGRLHLPITSTARLRAPRSGTVDAGELVVNLKTNVSTFSSKGNGRVTGIFTSQ